MKPKLLSRGTLLPAIIMLGIASTASAQTSTWTNNGDGLFSNATNWDNGSPNNSSTNAIIDDGDSAVIVTLDASRTIKDLTIGPDDSLLINNNTSLSVAGNIDNSGLVQLNSLGNTTSVNISGAGDHELTGSGIIRLGNSANRIAGNGTLVNTATHTIEGGGNIGANVIGINNLGLIRANVAGNTMTIDPSAAGGLINTGTMRAENGGTLLLTGTGGGSFDNTGGSISALAGSSVRMTASLDITGGTLSTAGDGSLSVDGGQTVFLTNLTNAGNLTLNNNSDLRLSGGIVNSGSISTAAVGNPTNIRIEAGGVTLSGGGTMNFQSTSGINGGATGARLTNVDNTISGSGSIGQNTAAFTNGAAGIIQANINAQTLTLDPVATATDGDISFINNGILRASNGGILLMTGSGSGNFQNNNRIEALDLSTVLFQTSARVTGGTLSTSGSGSFVVDTSQNAFFTGITNTGNLIARNNSDLGLSGSIVNSGNIRLQSTGNQTDMEIQAGGVTLSGGGNVFLENSTTGINTALTGTRLTNADNLISGTGSIGQNTTAITNSAAGIIQANAGTLTLDPVATAADSGASFLNNGTLRATGGGTLILTGNGGGAFTNNDRIEALNGSEVQLTGGVSVTGGILATTGSGLFRANASQDVFLKDLTLAGNLVADNNTDLGISGSITNNGTITLTSAGNQTDLEIQTGGATLNGGGTVTFANSTTGLNTAQFGARFTNVDNTLQGQGSIGQNNTAITNSASGLINANINGGRLTLDPSASAVDMGASFRNDGILRASNGGILMFNGLGGGDFTNNNLIEALAGSTIELTGGASITGGTLSTSDDGVVRALANQDVFLKDLSNEGNIVVENNTDLGISGFIQNGGSITLTSAGNQTDLEIQSGGATLIGGGTITLANQTTGINSNVSGSRLTNADNTIQGRGFFGQNTLAITNGPEALIDANISGATLLIDPVATASDCGPSFFNRGIVQASNGGTLSLTGSGGGTFTNDTNGSFQALDGSTLNMVGGAVLTNNAAGTLTGGRYIAVDSGNGANLTLLGTPVTSIAADTLVDLSGANSAITFNGTALSQTLTGNAGTLRLRDGRVFNNVNALSNSGTLDLRGGTFSAPTLTSTGLISGFGNVNVRPANLGDITANGGTLTFSNGITGIVPTSAITVNGGAALDISGGTLASSTATLAHNGTNLNLGANNLTVSSDYTNANFGTGNAFNARANVTGTGAINATGNTTQTITGAASGGTLNFGNVHVGDSSTLNYQIANSGTTGPALRGAIQTSANGGNVTDSRISGAGATASNFGPIATGANSGDLGVTFNATSAGALSGQSIHVENNFDNVAGSDIAITGAAYRLAAPSVTPNPVNFGIIHVGDVVSQNFTIANTATADGFSESLNASFSSSGSGINTSGSVNGLAAGATDSSSLAISLDTSTARFVSDSTFLSLVSDGAGTSGLGTTSLSGAEVAVTAQVNNFAAPSYILQSGAATLSQDDATSFTLDFGTVFQNSGGSTANLAIANDVLGPADTLAGTFDIGAFTGFTFGGFLDFADIEGGESQSGLTITLDTSSLGNFTGTAFLDPRSQNASGFDGMLNRITLNIRGSVAVPEPSSSALFAIALFSFALRRERD